MGSTASNGRSAKFDDLDTASQDSAGSDISATVRKQEGGTCKLHSILTVFGSLLRTYGELDEKRWNLVHDYLYTKGHDKFYCSWCKRGTNVEMMQWFIDQLNLMEFIDVNTIWDRGDKEEFAEFTGEIWNLPAKRGEYLTAQVSDFSLAKIESFEPFKQLCHQFGYVHDGKGNQIFGYDEPEIWGLYSNVKHPKDSGQSGHAMAARPRKTMRHLTDLCKSFTDARDYKAAWPPSKSPHVYVKNSHGEFNNPFPEMDILNVQQLIALQETQHAHNNHKKFKHRVYEEVSKLLSQAQHRALRNKQSNPNALLNKRANPLMVALTIR